MALEQDYIALRGKRILVVESCDILNPLEDFVNSLTTTSCVPMTDLPHNCKDSLSGLGINGALLHPPALIVQISRVLEISQMIPTVVLVSSVWSDDFVVSELQQASVPYVIKEVGVYKTALFMLALEFRSRGL